MRAGGVETERGLITGGANDRARPAFRSLRRAGRVPPLGNGAPRTSALYWLADAAAGRGLGAEPSPAPPLRRMGGPRKGCWGV